jgi:transposase
MLADKVDHIIGVDTHKDSHTIALVSPAGAATAHRTVPANPIGYLCGYRFAVEQAPGRRVWAIEGTGSYGAGLTAYLLEQGEWVVEIDRPARPARRNGAKTDDLDAVRAAREALGRDHLAQPRRRGDREAIRVLLTTRHSAMGARTCAINHLKALVVNAPQRLREQLRALATDQLLARCARLRSHPPSRSSIAPRSSGCAAPPSARSPSKPRPTSSTTSSTPWSTGSRRGCWPSQASG